MRVLALDLGAKRIGVAISDTDGRVATPILTLQRSGDRARDHRNIADLIEEWGAEQVVVGLPLSLDGSTGPAAAATIGEVDELGATIGVPIETYDERFTTVTAERSLIEQGLKAGARRIVIDQVAAAVLLQAWLDRRPGPEPAPPADHTSADTHDH